MEFKLTEKAKKVLELVKGGMSANEIDQGGLRSFIEDISTSDGFWYGLTGGGYINVENVIADVEQAKKIKEAINLLSKLEPLWNDITLEF